MFVFRHNQWQTDSFNMPTCQVDDFAIAAPDAKTANILLDMLDEKLTIPIKTQGYLDMHNGADITQTRDYIKILCKLFVEKSCEKYMAAWMNNYMISATRPTPLPSNPTWLKKFNTTMGTPTRNIMQS
jgi:hypothetical protein